MIELKGKGFYIWQISHCEKANPDKIAHVAFQAGLSHVIIKIANGIYEYNKGSAYETVLALKEKGIQAWGWHYVFGDAPKGEAKIAIKQLQNIPVDGYVIDAESEYKGKYTPCRIFLNELKAAFPTLPMALSSFRYPKYHADLPWKDFFLKVDINMPQVYWEKAHNSAEQLVRCLAQFQIITPLRPVIPTGPTYSVKGWLPTPQDIKEFLDKAAELRLSAVNFYSWDYCRLSLPHLWDVIAEYNWPGTLNPPKDITEELVEAMNFRRIQSIMALYATDAVHITPSATIQGHPSISKWYDQLLNSDLKNYVIRISGFRGDDNSRQFTWIATANDGKIKMSIDTIGLINKKIVYHYSSILK